jgi:hypothetical protein
MECLGMYIFNPYANLNKRSKYGNKKTVLGNVVYDSQKEANRAFELAMLEKAGIIKDLKRQVRFELIPSQKNENGKVLFRPVVYIADFTYTDCKTGEKIIEDVKGFATSDFKLKQKMMYYFYHIKIRII